MVVVDWIPSVQTEWARCLSRDHGILSQKNCLNFCFFSLLVLQFGTCYLISVNVSFPIPKIGLICPSWKDFKIALYNKCRHLRQFLEQCDCSVELSILFCQLPFLSLGARVWYYMLCFRVGKIPFIVFLFPEEEKIFYYKFFKWKTL